MEQGKIFLTSLLLAMSLFSAEAAASMIVGTSPGAAIMLADSSNASEVRAELNFISTSKIFKMVASEFIPESGYEFEFVLGASDISDGSDFAAVRRAFNTWVDLPGSAISITETTYDGMLEVGGTNGQNEVSWIPYTDRNWWTDVLNYPVNAIAVVVTWYNLATKQVVERDMHFNDTYMYWYTDSDGAGPGENPFYVEHIALHEAGHIYGLNDIYNPGQPGYVGWMGTGNGDLAMYGYSGSMDEDITLTEIDMAAMAIAHPVPETTTVGLLGLGSLLMLGKRRRPA